MWLNKLNPLPLLEIKTSELIFKPLSKFQSIYVRNKNFRCDPPQEMNWGEKWSWHKAVLMYELYKIMKILLRCTDKFLKGNDLLSQNSKAWSCWENSPFHILWFAPIIFTICLCCSTSVSRWHNFKNKGELAHYQLRLKTHSKCCKVYRCYTMLPINNAYSIKLVNKWSAIEARLPAFHKMELCEKLPNFLLAA